MAANVLIITKSKPITRSGYGVWRIAVDSDAGMVCGLTPHVIIFDNCSWHDLSEDLLYALSPHAVGTHVVNVKTDAASSVAD